MALLLSAGCGPSGPTAAGERKNKGGATKQALRPVQPELLEGILQPLVQVAGSFDVAATIQQLNDATAAHRDSFKRLDEKLLHAIAKNNWFSFDEMIGVSPIDVERAPSVDLQRRGRHRTRLC